MSHINDEEIMSEFLAESYENLDQIERDLVVLEKEPGNPEIIARIFRAIHTIKGTSGFLGLNKLESISHTGENLLSRVRDGLVTVSAEIINTLLSLIDALRTILKHVETDKTEGSEDFGVLADTLKRLQSSATTTETLQAREIPTPTLKPASNVEIPITTSPVAAEKPIEIHREPTVETRPKQDDNAHDINANAETTVRVNVALLDKLMNLVGELVLARNQILQCTTAQRDPAFLGASQRLNLITTELQEGIMKTRMQPINNIWSKLPRVVRDLAQSGGKQVAVEMEGKDTELDKTLIEAIKDPLTHLVRNAVDHGIETPEIRLEKGKPAAGTLTLKAFHEGGQVNIEISDDGAGINFEKIKNKALQKNLMSADQLALLNEREIMQLIYMPGFSTAEKVTNVSGRGVGLDVVKTNIEKIGGTVDTQNRPGGGTIFRIKIPLTLAIIPALVVTCGGDRYAIPQVSLLELVRIENTEADKRIEWVHGSPVYRLRGNLLPLVFLNRELNLPEANTPTPEKSTFNIVVLQMDGTPFGLVVDDVNDSEEIVVKPMGKQLKGIKGFSGATIMGDGHVALILDVNGLAQKAGILSHHAEHTSAPKPLPSDEKSESQSLLLFDGPNKARMAIPLSLVARLEEFPISAIEYSNGRPVVQYRNQIMPLLHLENATFNSAEADPNKSVFPVVVYSNHKRSIGLVVDEILDIVDGETKLEKVSDHAGILGSIIIQQRTTDLLDMGSIIRAADPTFFEEIPVTAENQGHA